MIERKPLDGRWTGKNQQAIRWRTAAVTSCDRHCHGGGQKACEREMLRRLDAFHNARRAARLKEAAQDAQEAR
jgi:hypothetical protein